MKKILSVALSTAMAFSMFASVAFGADAKLTPEQQFNALKEAGIVSGFPDGLSHLEKTLTRAELAKIIVNSLSLEPVDATSYNDKNYANHWGRTYIEAATQAGILNGKDAAKKLFDPNGAVTVQELAKVLVTALKLEVPADANNTASAWAKGYVAAAVNAGYLADGINYQAQATRSQAVVAAYAIYEATQTPKVKSYKVVDSKNVEFTLSNDEVVKVTLETALEANKETEVTFKTAAGEEVKTTVKWEVTSAQKLVSATASNYKELIVKFDGELDKATAENTNNYKVSGVNFESATLSQDKTEVTLLVANDATALPKQKETTLEVKGVKNFDASKTIEGSLKFVAVDTTLPTIKSATALGTKAFKVVFSEPVTSASASNLANYKVDGKAISGYVTFTYPNIAFVTTDLAVGEHTLTVQNVTDFNNFKIATVDTQISVVEDTTAPEIVSIKATDLKKVEIEFNEPVKSVSKAYHTSSSRSADKVTVNDNKVTLTFNDTNRLSLGESTVYLEGVTDYSNNSADRNAKVTPVLDTTRPVVTSVKAEAKTTWTEITVELSKDVLESDIQNTDNYVLRNSKGEIFSGKGFTTKGHPVTPPAFVIEKGKKVESKVLIKSLTKLDAGKYSLEISGIRDQASIGNTLAPQTVDFTVTESGAVVANSAWYSVDGDDTLVYVQYNKPIAVSDAGSALELNKYDYKVGAAYYPFPAKSAKVAPYSANTVVITVPTADLAQPIASATHLRINNVADLDGNYIAVGSEVLLKSQATSTISVDPAEVKAKDRDTVVVKFDGELTLVDKNDFVFSTFAADEYEITDHKVVDGKSVVEFTFDEEDALPYDPTAITLDTVATANIKSQDGYGRKLTEITTPIALVDEIKPEAKKQGTGSATAAKDNKVTLEFTENVNAYYTPGSFVVRVNGDEKKVTGLTSTGNTLVVLTLDTTVAANDTVEVYLTNNGKYVVDATKGNPSADINLSIKADAPTVVTPVLAVASAIIAEDVANDGTITETQVVTLTGTTFAAAVAKADVTITGLPAGLDYTVTRDSATQITIAFTGAATNHADANDVASVVITVAQTAVTGATGNVAAPAFAINFAD